MCIFRFMSTTNRDASSSFTATDRRIVWGNRSADLHGATAEAIAWDGAASTTTGAVFVEQRGIFCYVEIRETGRSERMHTGGVFGLKGMMRFTGADDSGKWIDVVLSTRR